MKTHIALLFGFSIAVFSNGATVVGQEAAPAAEAPAATDSHTQAVEEFFVVMKMKETSDKTIDQMLQMQMQQNPQLAQFKDVMAKFLRKHVSYESLKTEMVALYKAEFTEDEVKTLTEFYKTPVGQKAVSKLPTLVASGAQLGMQRVQMNMGELQQAIAKRQAELQPPATP
jgi:hypothetical protein